MRKKKDLSVWDFVAADPFRPVMNNVHYNHEDKVAVASNFYKMFVSHKDYRPLHKKYEAEEINMNGERIKKIREYEVYDKYDNGIEGRYPNYKIVIPNNENLTPVTLASEEELKKRIAEAKAEHNSLGRRNPNQRISISVMGDDRYGVDFTFDNRLVKLEHVNIMLSAGLDGWKVKFGNRLGKDCKGVEMFVKKFENGDVLLLMPTIVVEDCIKYKSFQENM